MDKVEEVTAQLKVERLKSLGLENQLHNANFSQIRTEEVTFNSSLSHTHTHTHTTHMS